MSLIKSPKDLQAQYVYKIILTPTNPTPSDSITILVEGGLPCTGIFLADSTISISDNMIQIYLNFESIADICLPILMLYSVAFSAGRSNPNSYLVHAESYYHWRQTDFLDTTNIIPSLTNVCQISKTFDPTIPIRLFQNFPNPFNPSTQISYYLPKSTFIFLTVFNILGQQAKRLVNEFQSSGVKTITWDAYDSQDCPVPSGIYIYQIVTSYSAQSKKMFLQR